MKKIIGIIGSLRKESIHRVLFNEYKELAKNEFSITEGEIKDIPLFNEELLGSSEAALKLGKQIKDADGVIFFSPEYNYSIPAPLKNAIDWLSRDESAPFSDKRCTIIGASPGNIGTARMQYHLRQVGVFLNIHFLNKPEVMIGKAYDKIKNGKIEDQGTKDFLEKHISAFNSYLN